MSSPKHIPELLAPAGGMQAFRAAVSAGADAVYLGMGDFNARRGAENFDTRTLAEALRFAHLRGVSVYLTVNVVVLPEEMDSVLDLVDTAWAAGVDAVIVQDLGLMDALRRYMPQVRVHASTQVNAHSGATVTALCALGAKRVTLARETSLDEVSVLASVAGERAAEVETFTHGALCVCYSGQCLLSSLVGGRSANRGQCAQPCRLPYELIDEAERSLADVGAHLLSPKDLAAIEVLPRLIASGTAALKLEGRMKSAEYVALVTGIYRAALDRAGQEPDAYSVREGERAVLAEAFSRGFTEAYLIGERGNDMMSYVRPNNRGVQVGRVQAVEPGGEVSIDLSVAAEAEDTIEVWTSRGRFAQPLGPMQAKGVALNSAPAGARVKVKLSEPVSVGDRIFRVRNAALMSAAQRLFSAEHGPAIPLNFSVRVVVGKPLQVTVEDSSGRIGTHTGPPAEAARTKAITAAEISEHVGRLGGTPYTASAWDIELSPGAGMSYSALHSARRSAIEAYEARVLEPWSSRQASSPSVPAIHLSFRRAEPPLVVASVSDLTAATECLDAGADEVHVPAWELDSPAPKGVVPVVPRICHDFEMQAMHAPAVAAGRAVAGTLGSLRTLTAEHVRVQTHWSLNVLNEFTATVLADKGAEFLWLSPELELEQVAQVAGRSPLPVGVAVWGRQEVMVTEHCILMSEGDCARDCVTCGRRRKTHYLKDRKGYRFPVMTDPTGRSHVYNSVPLDVVHVLGRIVESGVSAVRLDVETETPKEAAAMVAEVKQELERLSAGLDPSRDRSRGTTGHYFKRLQ